MDPRPPARLLRLLLPALLGAAALLLSLSPACSSTALPPPSGDFAAPAALAVAPARDRNLLFIASTGNDDLRAITICTAATLPDGGDPPDSGCQPSEDFQFLPGPIRVFPGSFPVGNRPVRIAAVSMHAADGTVNGAVLVAGVSTIGDQPSLKLVDSVNVMDAVQKTAGAKKATDIPLDAPPIDVIALDTPAADGGSDLGVQGGAFVLSQAIAVPTGDAGTTTTVPGEISRITLTPSTDGPKGVVTARCSLGDILATRIAVAPGRSDKIYVADASPDPVAGGRGDGVLEIDATAIPAVSSAGVPDCVVTRRLAATNPSDGLPQGVYALALSPAYYTGDGRVFPSGAWLIGITAEGRVVIFRTETGKLAPLPPFKPLPGGGNSIDLVGGATAVDLPDGGLAQLYDTVSLDGGRWPDGGTDDPADGGHFEGDGGIDLTHVISGFTGVPPMEPLREGQLRDVTFLKTPTVCPVEVGIAEGTPCVIVRVGGDNGYIPFHGSLVAAVTSADGSVFFLDVDKRRFISDVRDSTASSGGSPASVTSSDQLKPVQPVDVTAPVITFPDPTDLLTQGTLPGWATAGVSRNSTWRIVWHGQVPGLERRGGTLSALANGQLKFQLPGVDFSRWTQLLDLGDVISFATFSKPDGSALCQALQDENALPLNREFNIAGIGPDYLVLDNVALGIYSDGGSAAFLGSDCLPVGATAETRTAKGFGNKPWLVLQGNDVHGRAASGSVQIFNEPRFDYPIDYAFDPSNLSGLPTPDKNIGLAFTITGSDPVIPGSYFSVVVASGQSPTRVADAQAVNTTSGGFGSQVITYTSAKLPGNLVFAAITGSNEITQIDPQLLGVLGAVITYH